MGWTLAFVSGALVKLFIVSSQHDGPTSSYVLLCIHFDVVEQQLAVCLLAMCDESELGGESTGN